MPSPKGLTPEQLEAQSAALQALIDDAHALQREITEHLKKLRQVNQSMARELPDRQDRRKKPRPR